ncbi:hypothetical protein AB0J83_09840 [Actinoplanes sp. NPDC049596]|uniref:hypothetical protein n=1 Tax=unclassified Actinoplanes TaxID=2626549 RepID=UPI0034262173
MGDVLMEVEQLCDGAAKLAAAPLWPLADDEIVACLRAAYRLEQAATVLQARLAHHAETRGVPGEQGHRDLTGWVRSQLLLDPRPARDRVTSKTTSEPAGSSPTTASPPKTTCMPSGAWPEQQHDGR